MNTLLQCLVNATVMLTIACGLVAFLLRRLNIVTPRLRQAVLFCVILQGLMLFRLPVELPWLDNTTPAATLQSSVTFAGAIPSAVITADDQTWTKTSGDSDRAEQGLWLTSTTPTRMSIPGVDIGVDHLVAAVVSIWLTGFLVVVLRGFLRYRGLCRTIDRLDRAPESWQSEWAEACRLRGRVAPEMLVSQSAGPMLVRRPQGYSLVVPHRYWSSLSKHQRRGVLLHELAHLCRHDVWRQLIARTAASLHWWNPAAWWCVRRYEESAEWLCDEWLTQTDPAAAKGLASSLVQLVEFAESQAIPDARVIRGVGVQSMAAPPLTERVTRLLKSSPRGDSVMKRLFLVLLAAGLMAISTVQFRLVAAPADGDGSATPSDERPGLRVLSADSKDQLQSLRGRLNTDDKLTAELNALLATESGQVAFAGAVDQLEQREREKARDEAIPRFVKKHFETTSNGKLILREQSKSTAASWVKRSKQLGNVLDEMHKEMKLIADRLDDSSEVNEMARRIMTDEHAGFAIVLGEFDGRSDPIDLFLGKALEKILVRKGDKMVVIPTLSGEQIRQIERFEKATEVAARLRKELPAFADEFALVDQRHKDFVAAMKDPAAAAIVAMQVTKDDSDFVSEAVDRLFDQLEKVSRDTPKGLVIDNEEAWRGINELMESVGRASQRVDAVRERMMQIADSVDTSDPTTARLATQLRTGVIAFQAAADIPYAEFDLSKQVTGQISQSLEPVGNNGLRVRDDMAAQVSVKAQELLTASRTIRRYLRRVDEVCDSMQDRQLAESLGGPGRMLLLSEIRRSAEQDQVRSLDELARELFTVDEATNQLTVRPDRAEAVGRLAQRAKELEAELSKDDF
ncbi:MAG: M56 family metallopeptidase [Planctomycetales bacterium]|nr:M56 family metallopeptidase [Planctomycetales bacterium]